jgi:hypothetical protein
LSNARGKGSKVFIFGTRPAGRSRYGSPNGGVAPSEQLNVVAALDQGTRLFLLQARYQDAGDVQAEYYLAGPHGISHQSLRTLFPLREWLAAHGHEHELVMLGFGSTRARPTRPASTPPAWCS